MFTHQEASFVFFVLGISGRLQTASIDRHPDWSLQLTQSVEPVWWMVASSQSLQYFALFALPFPIAFCWVISEPPKGHMVETKFDLRERLEATCSRIVLPALLGDGSVYRLSGLQYRAPNTLRELIGYSWLGHAPCVQFGNFKKKTLCLEFLNDLLRVKT